MTCTVGGGVKQLCTQLHCEAWRLEHLIVDSSVHLVVGAEGSALVLAGLQFTTVSSVLAD